MSELLEQIKDTQEKLRKMTFLDEMTDVKDNIITFKMPDEDVEGYVLYEDNIISIGKVRFQKGIKTESHEHEGTEIIIVKEGKVVIGIRNKEFVIKSHGSFIISPDTEHTVEFLETSSIIFITIPKEKAYSNERPS